MKAVYVIALIVAVIAFIASAEVVQLTSSNFDSYASKGNVLVKFFAPWCGHCKSLKVPYEEAAKKLVGKAVLAEADCTSEDAKDLCSKYDVKGYPTIKFFGPNASVEDYEEGRTTDAIVGFMLSQSSPAVTYITSEDELKEFKASPMDLKVIVNVAKDSDAAKSIEGVAKSLRKTCAIAINTLKDDGKTTLYRTFDEPEVQYDGKITTGGQLTKFVNENSLPVIGEIGPANYKKYVDKNLPLTWIFVDYNDKAQVKAVEDIKAVAKKYVDKLLFAKLDGTKWAQHAQSFGLEKATPGIVIEDRTSRKKYAYPAESITVDAFESFLKGFVGKTLTPIFKSEPVPATNDQPVKIVVGKSFNDVVINNEKDVLIAVTATWCGHCKALKPKYEELATKLQDDSNVVIAQIDGTLNDLPFEVSGFPTVTFYPAHSKQQPIRYTGAREVDDFIAFINKNRQSKVAEKSAHGDEL